MPLPYLWALLLPLCVLAAWLVLRQPVRLLFEDRDAHRARAQFRLRREGLEAKFLAELAGRDPVERLRWEDAQWSNEVVWARDRQSRRLLALIGVRFEPELVDGFAPEPARYATAVFSFEQGRWRTDGLPIDEIGPDEAFRRHREFEPVAPPYRRP